MFYDRPNELLADGTYPASEWAVDVTLDGGGYNGGEVTLTGTSSEEVTVRNGQWIMLIARTPPINNRRIPLCRWYRVIDSDDPVTVSPTISTCSVTLAGPDFTDTYDNPPGIRAVICKGVVGVYEKTIKLDSQP